MVTQVKPLCILVLASGTHFHELHPSKSFVKGSLLYMTETNKIQRLIKTYIIFLDFVRGIEVVS